jgi:hypothetical protein
MCLYGWIKLEEFYDRVILRIVEFLNLYLYRKEIHNIGTFFYGNGLKPDLAFK